MGALILTLTLVPVLCAMWFKKGVHEKENKPFQWILKKYAVWLDWCLDRPVTTLVLAGVIFVAALLLIPFIGGEFMPHLDEGAMWIRATMPYTVSFETSSKFSPQVRDILMKYPDGDGRGLGAGAAGRWHRPDRILQRRILRRAEAV